MKANVGISVGGPAAGRELCSSTETIIIPVKTGPDRGEGDRGFSAAVYKWIDGKWTYVEVTDIKSNCG